MVTILKLITIRRLKITNINPISIDKYIDLASNKYISPTKKSLEYTCIRMYNSFVTFHS